MVYILSYSVLLNKKIFHRIKWHIGFTLNFVVYNFISKMFDTVLYYRGVTVFENVTKYLIRLQSVT